MGNIAKPCREPPYSAGQTSSNDNNANVAYPTLDESIRKTYVARSTATSSRTNYDSYIRAIRWAANRVLTSPNGGIICYVSNGGYIDSNSADGLRKTLTTEFHDIYIYNLRGNQRTAGELSRKEGGKIFDSGSRNTVAIMLLIKRPEPVTESVLHYKDIGDYLDRKQKLDLVDQSSLDTIDWETLTPNKEGDWINQRDPNYETYPVIGDKNEKNGRKIFKRSGPGLVTNRDAWVYNSSEEVLADSVGRMIKNYSAELGRWSDNGRREAVKDFVDADPSKISWSRGLRKSLEKGVSLNYDESAMRVAVYRPFQKQNVYMSPVVNEVIGQQGNFFPAANRGTIGFYNAGASSAVPFSAIMCDAIPDLHVTGAGSGGQFFARHYHAESDSGTLFGDTSAQDNITDWALSEYRNSYGDQVSTDDIFYYTYGLLHSPEYRERYAADLKRSLPRIPQVQGRERFEAFVQAGQELAELHIGYENLVPYPLAERLAPGVPEDEYERYTVTKMKYAGKAGSWDKTRIRYNAFIDIEGIPEDAQRYMLGSRSGVDWIIERHQVKQDKASGIVNDPNDWSREHEQPRYIIDLIGRITTLSIETLRIIDGLPNLELRK